MKQAGNKYAIKQTKNTHIVFTSTPNWKLIIEMIQNSNTHNHIHTFLVLDIKLKMTSRDQHMRIF